MSDVLMTTDAVGGVWTYSLDVSRELATRSVSVTLAVVGPAPTPDQLAELAGTPLAGWSHVGGALEWMPEPWRGVDAAANHLLDLAADVRPDVVHLHDYSHGVLPWAAPTLTVAHSDVLSWWRAVHGQPAPPEWDEYRARVTAGLDAVDMLVAPSRGALAALERELGRRNGRVIHNGRAESWVSGAPKERLVLTAGRLWDAAKNVEALAAVAPALPWPVLVAGEASGGRTTVGPSGGFDPDGELPTEPGVVLLGRLPFPVLARWLARAAIYAAPARYEPFGLGVLEAAMSGCALVLGDIPTLRELWGGAALFVAPDDHDAWRRTLDDLTRAPQRCAVLGEQARRHAARYRIGRVVDAYHELYRISATAGAPRR